MTLSNTTVFLPLLNGISHIDYLRNRFGKDKVLGGAAHIASVLTSENVIKQLNPIQILTIGSIGADLETTALQFKNLCESAKFKTIYTEEILQALWDKWTFLATLAGSTTLFNNCVGEITSSIIGERLMKNMYQEALSIAEIKNYNVDEKAQTKALEILMKPSSDFTSSMLRDLQAKKPTEHEHILGDLVRMGMQHKLDIPLLSSAYVNILVAQKN
jgi:2-dehydropantoate 2-reductase